MHTTTTDEVRLAIANIRDL
jgi:hypothetical protein